MPGPFSPASSLSESSPLEEAGRFAGGSGSDNLRDRYYLVALVLHDRSDPIARETGRCEASLRDRGSRTSRCTRDRS